VSIEKLIAYFDRYIPLNKKEKEEIVSLFFENNIKRKGFILQENEVCKHHTFVVSGLLKMYAVDRSGTKHNIQFASEEEWINDMGSFHLENPSRLYIEAIESSVILQIKKTDLIYLFTHYRKFNIDFRVIIENKFMEMQNRLLQNLIYTGEERYLLFLRQYPTLSNRLPNTQIASYLGITPEFLSKIRHSLSKK